MLHVPQQRSCATWRCLNGLNPPARSRQRHFSPDAGATVRGDVMKFKNFQLLCCIMVFFGMPVSIVLAQDNANTAAMSALTTLLASPAAGADAVSRDPEALKAAQLLMAFPPHIQKRLEKVVLMIVQENGENPTRSVDSMNRSGPEGAFQSFSPAIQREIQAIARELEQDPEFMKKTGRPK